MNTAMKSAGNPGASTLALGRSSKFVLAAAVAALALAAPRAGATTTVYSDSFDTYANNVSLTTAAGGSWSKDGSGAAVATTAPGLPEAGAGAALLTPVSAANTGTWLYRSSTLIANPASSAEPVVTASAGLRITSPASGTANRSVVLGLQTYDSNVDTIGSALLIWDGANTYGFGSNHLVLQFDWGDGSSDFGYDFGVVTSAQLSAAGYFDVSVSLDYSTGDIAFGWGNSTLGHAFAVEDTHGSFDPGSFSDFSDADFYYARGSTGGTLPRLVADNYLITTAPSSAPTVHTIGGTVGGTNLAGLVLQDNGGDDLAVNSAGAFTFASPLAAGASYDVTVLSSPSGQSCSVTNGSGIVPDGNVTNVDVECTANTYALSGSVQNLTGSGLKLILTVDDGPGENVFPDAGATSFGFTTPVPTGAQWNITVDHQPANPYQTCTATPSSGTMPAGDVSDIVVACTTNAYAIGGNASGIDVPGLVLQLNGGNDLPVNTNGAFTFAASVDSGATYTVTILSQPAGRSCTLGNASGTVGASDVTDVSATCIALPQLALSVSDGSDFARYGQIVDYTITLTNNGDGDAADVTVTFTLSAAFDAAFAQLACYGADGGATCTQEAGNPLLYHVALPAHRTLTWLVSVPVRADTPDATIDFGVGADGATPLTDTDTLVIFRDGFDVPYSDGAQSVPIVDGAQAKAILDGDALREVAIPDAQSAMATTLLIVRDDARDVRVDRHDVIGLDLVRLHARDADGRERATPWGVTRAGATLEFGSEAARDASNASGDGAATRNLVLVGANPALSLRR